MCLREKLKSLLKVKVFQRSRRKQAARYKKANERMKKIGPKSLVMNKGRKQRVPEEKIEGIA